MWGSNRSPGAPPPMHQQQQQQQQQQQVAPPSAGVHDLFSNMYGQDEAPSQYHYTPAPAAPQPSSYHPKPSQNAYPSSNPPSYQAASSPQYPTNTPANGYGDGEACQPVYAQKNKVYGGQSYGAEDNAAPGQPPIEHYQEPEPEPAVAYSRQGSQIYSPLQSAELYDPRTQNNSEPTISPVYGQTSPGQQAGGPNSYFAQSGGPSFSPGQSNAYSPGQSNAYSPGQSNAYSPGQSNAYSPGQSNSAYSPVAYKPQTSHPYTGNSESYSSSPGAGADKSDAYVHGTYSVEAPDHASRDNAFSARGMSYEEPFMPPPPPPEIAPMEPAPDTPGLAPPPPPTFGMPPSSEPFSPSTPAPPAPAPPPPPPLPSSSPNNSWKDKADNQNQASSSQPTRLVQQLSNMSTKDGSYPFANQTPASSAPGGPGYGAPSYVGGKSPTSPNRPPPHSPEKPQGHAMPDAVLNMAAKGPPEKKPWAYAPDMDSIKNQRDKVRRGQPAGNIPRYQHMLNMPDFSDPPKLITPPAGPTTPGQRPEDQVNEDGVYVHSQYNSPLQMYSNDNVDDAFSGQTGGKVSGAKAAGTPGTPNKDIVMSPTYRLIHGLDAGKPKQRVMPPPEARHNVRQPSRDDELKFSGLVSQSDIPSKSFHRLQQQVSNEPGVPQQASDNTLGVDDVGNYDETSIRYRGRNIPSKSFRMLQDMTGGPMDNLPDPAPRARQRRPAQDPMPPSPQQDPDDIVDIRFVGGNIPSRSFRMLQQSIGDTADDASNSSSQQPSVSSVSQGGGQQQQPHQQRNVKIIKLRSQAQTPPVHNDLTTDF